MRNRSFSTVVVCLVLAACGGTSELGDSGVPNDASNDSATCTGTPPILCEGCCGSKYAADVCVDVRWSCRPLGGACVACDAGKEAAAGDAAGDSATCTGTPPVICDGCCGTKYPADRCLNGEWTCTPRGIACVVCDAGADSASTDAASDSATCTGTPPVICDGCCGAKYPADQCLNGAWTCTPRRIAACVVCDAGADSASTDASSDSATCSGTPPLCFGNSSTECCGFDPSGSASCRGGEWLCGSAPAPGCNRASCLGEAGPG